MNNHQSTRRGFLRTVTAAASAIAAPVFGSSPALGNADMDGWDLGPFVKRKQPILRPTKDSTFRCPVRGKEVRWEEQNAYNPAAVVRNGKVYLLYRADDRSPDLKWGRTCRIGLAHSADGVHFTRHPKPVLYPDKDAWKEYEWEGGCEDLHIIEGEDGILLMFRGPHSSLGAWALRQALIDRHPCRGEARWFDAKTFKTDWIHCARSLVAGLRRMS